MLVLGSSGDAVCCCLKMQHELAPALGPSACFERLPNELGGHISLGDKWNTHVYELAGPRLGRWIADSVALEEPRVANGG